MLVSGRVAKWAGEMLSYRYMYAHDRERTEKTGQIDWRKVEHRRIERRTDKGSDARIHAGVRAAFIAPRDDSQ